MGDELDLVVAKGVTFHGPHFRCCECNMHLQGKGFLERDGQFFCEDDFYERFNPKCAFCEMAIRGQYVKAMDKLWHPNHFLCFGCETEFKENKFRKFEDRPYCEPCYLKARAAVCATCGLLIEGQVYSALGFRFHLECFRCPGGRENPQDHVIGANEAVGCPSLFSVVGGDPRDGFWK